ncbi:uncharacterized protein TRIVIDRAFT_44321 [Trichoderma virens Gv29-8]|uniref:USP domain-containing protein n=1 Tax=Hypocrea virens (strain Gv29-8 / FGSC 10586) TaxID=413071 RepID=G9N365_HYPVG|nr:uncharacterized protein TRIVIDRAFT_44321 [Trichoderma virens Gv29-8]EHK18749.1 hypothetical protein TRIVIDRAFT_44321 [Trichoderma virens Gv29-8]
MGLAPATSDFPGPKASPEPSSTRLNPFDDSDVSSRKRRRTSASGSGSPSASVETGVYLSDSGSSPFYTTVNAMPVLDGAVQPSQESKQPRTPPQNVDSPTIPPDPPASRGITINLRNPPSRASTASPTQPTPEEDKAKKSVEEAEPDVATNADADDGPQTPPTGWRASLSPPIEELFPGDHEMPDQADVELAANTFSPLDTGNVPPADPTMQFPYCDADTLPETVTQVSIYEQVRAWLDLYVQFAKARTPEDTFNSVYNNRVFWQSFLGLCGLITNKNLSPSAPPRLPILQRLAWKFSHSFVALTAQLVIVDFHTVRDWQAGAFQSSSESPSLISMDYLRQLHQLAQRSNYGPGSDPDSPNSASLGRSNLIAFFIEQLHDFTLEVIDSLCVFATGLIEIVQAFPRLVNILTPVIQSLTDCLNESCRPVRPGEPDEMTVKSNLIHVYHVWGDFSSLLLEIIEKHVGTLSSDGVSAQIQALAELLRRCLLYDGEGNITLLNEHRAMYPDIEGPLVYEAILWGWKVGILERLIKSSQMPLRLMSVTTMCSELVTAWKRYGIQSAVPNRQFTNHLGRLLLQTELIDYILGPNCHPELITESANIIGYLIVTKLYDQAHTDRLWQGITETQDPRVAKAVAKMANSVANLLDYPTLMSLCEKLQALPTPDFNQATKALWDTIHQELLSRCRAEGITLGFLPYDLCLRLLREAFISSDDPQPPSMEAQSAAMDKFRALLQFGPDSQGRQELYSSCIKDIAAKSPTTLGSLCCLTMAIRPNIADEMDVLIQEHDLVRLLVEELGHAVKLARTTSASLVFHGRFNQPRKDFIANLVRLRPDAISEDLGKRLWDLLVGPACLSDEDRNAGWEVFMDFGPGKVSKNPFLQLCFSQYLPDLPPSCFSRGMLLCVKKIVLAAVNNAEVDCDLDDETFLKGNGIEQLWRFVMGTSHASNAEDAIGSLAVGVYIKSQAITAYPFNRARRVQSAFVNRCLSQLKDSAMKIMASSDGASSGEDEPMVMVATEEEMLEQERIFTRALQLLRVFMEFHYTKPTLCAPDFRSIFHEAPCQVEGDLTALKYQSFDDGQATAIKPLHVGKLNTAAELISNLKFETGFDNYRAFYRGRQFLPLAKQVRASLESLHVEEGMILVKREENDLSGSTQIPSAASPLEIQVMSHFSELWGYLSLDDRIAKEVYSLLIKLPTGRHIINLFESPTTVYTDLFPPGQPYKFLYAIQAISKHIESVRLAESNSNKVGISYKEALRTSSSLVSQAISDESLLDQINPVLQVELMGALMHTFTQLLRNTRLLGESPSEDGVTYPDPGRLVNILADAANGVEGESSLPLIDTTLSSILQLCLSRSAFMKDIVNLASFKKLLHRLILLDPRLAVRRLVVDMIKRAVRMEDDSANAFPEDARPPSVLMQYFWLVISDLLFEATGSPHQCQEFFDGIDYLFCKAAQAIPCEVNIPLFAGQVCELLLNHTSTEQLDQPESQDLVANGLLTLLLGCLQLDCTLSASRILPDNLAEVFFQKLLFPQRRLQSTQPVQRVLLRKETRAKMYGAIFIMIKDNPRRFGSILQCLNSLVPYYSEDEDGNDTYIYDLPYQFDRNKAIRAHGYVGLRNLSNTCYLNSLLTQLFMNGEFRRFILAFNIEDPNDSQQLLFHTQKLFGYLQDSYRRCIDPGQLVNSIKTYDDVLIDIHNQMDVEEFYSLFFDRLESQPMTDDEKKKLRSIYGGQLVQQVKSQECEHVSERLEPFSAIQCDIHGKVSLRESLDAYVRGEVLEGDNKYKCSSCDRHVNAVKRACLKEVPDNLIFHLKRFEFNLRTQQRNKVNDYFSFPPTIDMRPYTIDHLSNPTNTDQQDDMFELVGILIHAGTAESGHYYSYIRERTSTWDRPSWVEFNDDVVTPWDPRQMAASAFGGTAGQPTGLDSGGTGFDKTYSAYMLFYQRSSSLLAEQQALLSTQEVKTPLHVDTDITPLKEHILNDNTVLLKRHCLYDPSHVEFVQHCFRHAKLLEYEPSPSPDEEQSQDSGHGATATHPHALKTLAMEMALSHFDQLVTRIEGTPNFDSFAAMIQSAVVDCRDCAFSFFEYFNIRPEAFRALVQRNPDADVRAFTGTTMVTVLRKIATEMPQIYDRLSRIDDENELASNSSGHEESLLKPYVLEEVMVSFDRLWRFFQFHLRSWDEVFGMMLQFAQLGPREVAYLLSNDFLLKLLRIIAADASMELPPNYAKMLHTIYRRPANRPPSYESILKLISYLLSQLESTLGSQYIVDAPEDRLAFHEPPFPWTSDEVHLIHHHPDRQLSSIFVEKLLGIDQAREATHSILGRLTALSTQMDLRVYTTLRRKIQGDTTTEPLDPFLRGASVYLETTLSASHSQNLMRHIAAQAESLHSTEGMAFLEHFQASLNLKRKDGTMAQTTAASSLETLPDWVPHLLAFPDNELRYNTERFLDAVLFSSAPNISAEDTTMQDGREGTRDVIQRLGIACLLYLRDAHIRRRILIGRDTAVAMVRVVGKCADYFSLDAEDDDNGSDFRMLQDGMHLLFLD